MTYTTKKDIPEALKTYIDENRQQGFSDKDIREALVESGWEETDVDTALQLMSATEHASKSPKERYRDAQKTARKVRTTRNKASHKVHDAKQKWHRLTKPIRWIKRLFN